MVKLPPWVRRRPILAAFATLVLMAVFVIPASIAGAWSFWSSRPFAEVLGETVGGTRMTGIIYASIGMCVALAGFALLFVIVGASLKPHAASSINGDEPKLHFYPEVKDGLCSVTVRNYMRTDSFAAQTLMIQGQGSSIDPHMLRWRGTDLDKREIVKGQRQILDVIRVDHKKDDPDSAGLRFSMTGIYLLTPNSGEVRLGSRPRGMTDVYIDFQLSPDSGEAEQHRLNLFVFCDGTSVPQLRAVLGP